MTGRAASKVDTRENKALIKSGKRSGIPVLKSRVPLRDVQPPVVVEGQTTSSSTVQRAHSAVREVPNFKQLHKQWERKLERAKRQRQPAKPCTPLPSTNMDKRHVHPPQTLTAVRAQPVIVSHTQQVDAILSRMAQSTNNAVRKISMMDRDNCSPVRANLSEQFSQVQDKHPKDSTDTPSTPSHTSRDSTDTPSHTPWDSTDTPSHTPRDSTDTPSTPSHTSQDSVDRPSAPSHTRAHPDPGVGTRHIPLAVAVRTVCNYYECEPELVGLVFRHCALETRSSGRRNPVGVALASVDKYVPTECFFTTIEGTAQSTC